MVTGYGISSIAAAAFVSTSTSERAHSSELAIALAFRVGSLIQRKLENVAELSFGRSISPWACLSLPLTVSNTEAVLKDFNEQNVGPSSGYVEPAAC